MPQQDKLIGASGGNGTYNALMKLKSDDYLLHKSAGVNDG